VCVSFYFSFGVYVEKMGCNLCRETERKFAGSCLSVLVLRRFDSNAEVCKCVCVCGWVCRMESVRCPFNLFKLNWIPESGMEGNG